MSEQKWVRSSLRHLSDRLGQLGHGASPPTVGRLLKKLGYSLHANRKQREGKQHEERDQQFKYIAAQIARFQALGLPVISVDTKKKELIGDFKNPGRSWSRKGEEVNVHDFKQDALGRAVPYGIYEMGRNRGWVAVGISGDTPQFAVDVIARWWAEEGCGAYPQAQELLILADSGGSNSARSRVWKHQLQHQLCDRYGVRVTVCHYPTGCSKWNPIEHRLFSFISINWAAKPLRSFATMLGYLRGTRTRAGLTVKAVMQFGEYKTGQKVSDKEFNRLALESPEVCRSWNYSIIPRIPFDQSIEEPSQKRELVA